MHACRSRAIFANDSVVVQVQPDSITGGRDRDIARHPQRESASRKRKRVPDFIDVRAAFTSR